MPARTMRRHGDVHMALLRDAHHSHGRGHAQGHASGNRAALIEDHAGMHVVLAQPRHGIVGRGARGLLAAGREEPDVARRDVALADEVLGRLEEGRDDVLGVERAAGPDLPVMDLGRKGRVGPLLAIGRHHVVVGHHHDGRQRGVTPRPAHEDAVPVDAGELERLERARIEALERGHPAIEGFAVKLGRVVSRDGGNTQQRAEALDLLVAGVIAARVDGRAGRKRWLERRRANHACDCQRENDYQDENDSNHGASCDVGAMVALPPLSPLLHSLSVSENFVFCDLRKHWPYFTVIDKERRYGQNSTVEVLLDRPQRPPARLPNRRIFSLPVQATGRRVIPFSAEETNLTRVISLLIFWRS